ncbi:MAG: hypothetical protein ACLQNE_06995, partial [Thermoguttaceae bacterium]
PFAPRKWRCFRGAKGDRYFRADPWVIDRRPDGGAATWIIQRVPGIHQHTDSRFAGKYRVDRR